MGILCVIYLWESHVSGQQGEKLPAYLLPSCWVLITVVLVAAKQKGLAPVLYQQKELAGKVGRKQVKAERSMQRGRNSGWNGESVSTEGSPITMLQGSWKCVLTLRWVLLHLLRIWERPHSSKDTFSSLFSVVHLADLRLGNHTRFTQKPSGMFTPGMLSHWNYNWWNYSVENIIDVQVG